MLFNSYPFLGIFLPVVLAGFFTLRWQVARLVWIVVASYVFYGYAKAWFPALMAGLTVISFTTGLALARVADPRRRRAVLVTGVAGALSLLLYFKYAQFAAGNASSFLSVVTGRGLPSLKAFTEGIALPVGISFYIYAGDSLDGGHLEALEDALRRARHYGWTLVGFHAPISTRGVRRLETDPATRILFRRFRTEMPGVFARYGFRFLDLTSVRSVGCSEDDFSFEDDGHPDTSCGMRVRRALDRAAGLRPAMRSG